MHLGCLIIVQCWHTIAIALIKHFEENANKNQDEQGKHQQSYEPTDYDYEWPHTDPSHSTSKSTLSQILCLCERPSSVLQTGVAEGE